LPGRRPDQKGRAEREHVVALRAALADWPGVSIHSKFGSASFQTGGKVFAFTRPEGVAMKLPEARVRGLVEKGQAEFLVMGKRTMREWMVLRVTEKGKFSQQDLKLLREAKEFVAGLNS
jgi:hypothetical protein